MAHLSASSIRALIEKAKKAGNLHKVEKLQKELDSIKYLKPWQKRARRRAIAPKEPKRRDTSNPLYRTADRLLYSVPINREARKGLSFKKEEK